MTDQHIDVAYSEWRSAAIDLGGEIVFAVGDVHGCAGELAALLRAIGATTTPPGRRRRLVFLGDMIDRGPDNIGVLKLWAQSGSAWDVHRIDRLMGNHEQLLLLAMSDSPHAPKAEAMWLSAAMGGEQFLQEMAALTSGANPRPGAALFKAALGDDIFHLFTTMSSHVWVGNALFVHAGLDPHAEPEEFLARPWTAFTEAQWAWVHGAFLEWRGGFGGRVVVHGHTPPHKHRELTGQADPHLLAFDRLGLDGGTTRTGIVTGAQIEDRRYRILRAGSLASEHGG